jgi:hypothetical protein
MPGSGERGYNDHRHEMETMIRMETRIKVTDQEKLMLLYERFRDVCLVEKEVWKEIFMPREVAQGPVRTNIQDRYDVEIDDPEIEDALDANIPRGSQSLAAAIQEYRTHISFYRKT